MSRAVGSRVTGLGRAEAGVGQRSDRTILLVDDHGLFDTTVVLALRGEGFDTRTVRSVDLHDLLGRPTAPAPGLAVVDVDDIVLQADGRRLRGVDLVTDLRARGWDVLIVTGREDRTGSAAAVGAGALGSVPRSWPMDVLLQVVMVAALGGEFEGDGDHRGWARRHRQSQARSRELAQRLDRLSPREREVLELLADGLRAAAIAAHLVVSMSTVRTQIRSILVKLQVGGQLEAVAVFRQQADAADLSVLRRAEFGRGRSPSAQPKSLSG